MTPEGWARLKGILGDAMEREAAERDAFLLRACGEDTELLAQARTLIASADTGLAALERTPAIPIEVMEGSRAGERAGAYEILDEIGHGGMGTVFLGRRADDQYRKKVAIKLVRRGMDTEFVLRRFRMERQILAALDHPHIARLIDGGVTDDGLPYFVMEHVEGQPLLEYCDGRRLSITKRLELFLDVCEAVQFAHQNLVVHRDLKPANILVTADGTVKLLDFGIAKLLNPELAGEAIEKTGTQMRLMTPEYASPEQVRGEPITTSSDVYSLGVILYELLTGQRPYRVKTAEPGEMVRLVSEAQPEKPSTAVTSAEGKTASASRETDPASLRRRLRGDLDNIVLMALRKEPQRRYVSVERLADDIRHHLEGRPVIARKATLRYRTGKLVRRHKLATAATLLAAAVIAGGLVWNVWETRRARAAETRAEKRFDDVRHLANSLLFEIHDQIRDLPGSTPARQTLVRRALEYLDSLSKERGGDAALTLELASAYQRVGDVQGNPYQPNLGDTQGAAASYRKAISLLEPGARSNRPDHQEALSRALFSLGGLELALGNPASAVARSRQGLDLVRGLSAAAPGDLARRRALATGLRFTAYSLTGASRYPEALALLREQTALLEELRVKAPQDATLQRELAQNRYLTGTVLDGAGDVAGALQAMLESIRLWRTLVAENGSNPDFQRGLAWALSGYTNLLPDSEARSALPYWEEAREVAERLFKSDPTSADARIGLARAELNLGEGLRLIQELERAQSHWAAARALLEPLVAADPSNTWRAGILGVLYLYIAEERTHSAKSDRDRADACDLFRKSVDMLSRRKEANGRALEQARAGLAACGR